MLSDTLADAESAIYQYQTEWAEMYQPLTTEINEIRRLMVLLQMKLDQMVPDEWLERNPIYAAAKQGNLEPHDRFMHCEDDSVLEEYRRDYAAYLSGHSKA